MNRTLIKKIHDIAEEFISIARMVNDSSKMRKKHSEEAINLIKQSLEIGEVLNHEIEIISKANKNLRNQDNIVLNSCIILNTNLENQKKIISELKKDPPIEREILTYLNKKLKELSASIKKALPIIQEIIETDNKIILMDNLIINRKLFQKESIQKLKKLALKTLEDAENAISGSSSNLNRGLKIAERIKKVKQLIERKDSDELPGLIDDANMGWHIAVNVNKSSKTQMEFAEKVNRFTSHLHEDSNTIKDFVVAKHDLFNKNLELITELTVILSLELKSYTDTMMKVEDLDYDQNLPHNTRDLINNLISYVFIACKDIESVANLNFDMTDTVNLNADLEKKSVDLTNMELEYFDQIKKEVSDMTEATKYPIEGSEKNIENGKLLEKHLKDIYENIKQQL